MMFDLILNPYNNIVTEQLFSYQITAIHTIHEFKLPTKIPKHEVSLCDSTLVFAVKVMLRYDLNGSPYQDYVYFIMVVPLKSIYRFMSISK